MPLNPATANRLVKLLGMLGSDHPGEVANAGTAAHRLLQSAGLTWADIIAAPMTKAAWREPTDWRDAVAICLGLIDAPLTDWDRRFLFGIAGREMLTDRQAGQLERIVTACRLHASAAA
jgi:hypothetical protein